MAHGGGAMGVKNRPKSVTYYLNGPMSTYTYTLRPFHFLSNGNEIGYLANNTLHCKGIAEVSNDILFLLLTFFWKLLDVRIHV
jgi:hypothetical protein